MKDKMIALARKAMIWLTSFTILGLWYIFA
jgi:hypothetical protein